MMNHVTIEGPTFREMFRVPDYVPEIKYSKVFVKPFYARLTPFAAGQTPQSDTGIRTVVYLPYHVETYESAQMLLLRFNVAAFACLPKKYAVALYIASDVDVKVYSQDKP